MNTFFNFLFEFNIINFKKNIIAVKNDIRIVSKSVVGIAIICNKGRTHFSVKISTKCINFRISYRYIYNIIYYRL